MYIYEHDLHFGKYEVVDCVQGVVPTTGRLVSHCATCVPRLFKEGGEQRRLRRARSGPHFHWRPTFSLPPTFSLELV